MIQLKDGIYWVGAVDWNIRNFHGYITQRGTSYNSYLVVDEKTALVDTVKEPFFMDMLQRIKEVIEPTEIDYIICNHIEPDHGGSIARALEVAENAELIASENGKKGLRRYFSHNLPCTTITEKPSVSLGSKTLQFVATPMVHWPDSMVTYIPEEKLLLSNDAFGQHLATSKRFDDEVDMNIVMHEAAKYYANIVMPLWRSVLRAIKALSSVEIDMIAPSHGIIWRSNINKILESYQRWVEGINSKKITIVYDTMWGSTEKVAKALAEGVTQEGLPVSIHRLSDVHNSDVIADVLETQAVLVGSPTLNNGLFPTVAYFLSYMKGLKPKNKLGAFFGSYGWGGGAKRAVEAELKASGIEIVDSDLDFIYKPSDDELEKAVEFGRMIAKKVGETPSS
jgi:flavorubredoxin